jgi:hypothetical protein
MTEVRICHRSDGVYWQCRGRERKITSDQAIRVMALAFTPRSGVVETEAISVMRFRGRA